LQQAFEEQSFGLDTGPQLFSHSFIALSITRCSGALSHYCYGKRAAGSKPILKLFIVSLEN